MFKSDVAAGAPQGAPFSFGEDIDPVLLLQRLTAPARRRAPALGYSAATLPLLALAGCGGGAGGGVPVAPTPQVLAPTLQPTTPPTVTAGQTGGATGNVLPAANQSGTSAATISAFSEAGGATGTVGQALTTTLGTLTLNSNGTFTFVVADNAAVKALPQGATQDVVINYTAGNSAGSANSTLKFTVTGINDAPVATGDSVTAPTVVTAPITGNVLSNDTDVDRGTTLTVTGILALPAQISPSLSGTGLTGQSQIPLAQIPLGTASVLGTFGTITIDSNGAYSYVLDKTDPDFVALRGGQTAIEKFEYTISDGQGGTAKAVLNITLTGVNDAPNAGADVTVSISGTNAVPLGLGRGLIKPEP